MDTAHTRTQPARSDGTRQRTPRHTDLQIDRALIDWSPPDQISENARAFRQELGLPTDRPVVMTGHQPVFWHAGILTKYLAADAIAAKHAARGTPVDAAWCVPDHTTQDPGVVPFPARSDAGSRGMWKRQSADLFADRGGHQEPLPPQGVHAHAALAATTGSPTTRQICAQAALLKDRLGLSTPHPVVLATEIGRTRLFADVLTAMLGDPVGCVERYNAAASKHPDAGVRPLAVGGDPDDTELPIWWKSNGRPPESIRAGEIPDAEPGTLVPRALLFTGLLRALGCDLFIHGTGGGIYDRVTEDWLGSWLGPDRGWTLAPTGVATATLTLDLGIPNATRSDLRDAKWRAHNARHNPREMGTSPALAEADGMKRALLARIRAAAASDRAPLYFEMHRLLDGVRDSHPEQIAEIDGEIRIVEAALADQSIASDRAWSWLLHDDDDLAFLRAAVVGTIGGAR